MTPSRSWWRSGVKRGWRRRGRKTTRPSAHRPVWWDLASWCSCRNDGMCGLTPKSSAGNVMPVGDATVGYWNGAEAKAIRDTGQWSDPRRCSAAATTAYLFHGVATATDTRRVAAYRIVRRGSLIQSHWAECASPSPEPGFRRWCCGCWECRQRRKVRLRLRQQRGRVGAERRLV